MRTDQAAEILADLARLGAEHAELCEQIWADLMRVAAVEFRTDVLVDRLAAVRHGVPVATNPR